MHILHLSDTHISNHLEGKGFEGYMGEIRNPEITLAETLKSLDLTKFDLIAVTGDLVHEGPKEDYDLLKSILEKYIPDTQKLLLTLGNHDIKAGFYASFFPDEEPGQYYRAVQVGEYRCITLDSQIEGKHFGAISDNQLQWLSGLFEEDSEVKTLIFMHHPIIWNGQMESRTTLQNGRKLLEVLSAGNVKGVLCGHTHRNAVNKIPGFKFPQISANSCAFNLEEDKEGNIFMSDQTGYTIVDINDDAVCVRVKQFPNQTYTKIIDPVVYTKYLKSLNN